MTNVYLEAIRMNVAARKEYRRLRHVNAKAFALDTAIQVFEDTEKNLDDARAKYDAANAQT